MICIANLAHIRCDVARIFNLEVQVLQMLLADVFLIRDWAMKFVIIAIFYGV